MAVPLAPALILLASFTTGPLAVVDVSDQYVLQATFSSQTVAAAADDLKDQMQQDGITTVAILRSIAPPCHLPPAGALRVAVFAAVTAHLIGLTYPAGFVPQNPAGGAPAPPAGPLALAAPPPVVLPPPPALPPAMGVAAGVLAPPAALPPPVVAAVAVAAVLAGPVVAAAVPPHHYLPGGPPPAAVAVAAGAMVLPVTVLPTPASPPRPLPASNQLAAFAPRVGPHLTFPGPLSVRVTHLSYFFNTGNPPLALVDGLSTCIVDLASSPALALARALSVSFGTIQALGFTLSDAGVITAFNFPANPAGSSAMLAQVSLEASQALGSLMAGGSVEYVAGRTRALTLLTDSLLTFVAATASRNPAHVAAAIVGWVAELFIRGTAIIPPRVGDWTALANGVCADHVASFFLPAVQASIQARTQAAIEAQGAASAASLSKMQEQLAAQASAHASALRAAASARPRERESSRKDSRREGGGGGGGGGGTESTTKRTRTITPKKSHYDEDADRRKIIVDYAVTCPIHGPGHKASECNCLLKPIGCATTVPDRYKDTKYPANGKSMDTTSKC